MAIVPTQERVIDPFSPLESKTISKLTRMFSGNNNIIFRPKSFQVTSIDNQNFQISPGSCFISDIYIEIQQNVNINYYDVNSYLIASSAGGEDGIYYLCLYYQYNVTIPAPEASIGLLKPSEIPTNYDPSTMLFLKAIDIQSNAIQAYYDYDPNNTTIRREYNPTYIEIQNDLPTFDPNRDNGRLLLITSTGNIYYGKDEWKILKKQDRKYSEETILTASDKAAYDNFSEVVDISSNGNVIVIGSDYADTGSYTNNGQAYVFRFNGSNWVEETILTASDKANYDNFGSSISISDDGNVVVIGTPSKTVSGFTYAGKVYVYRYLGGSWIEEAILVCPTPQDDEEYGRRVKISGDGNTIAITALYSSVGANSEVGRVFIYRYSGGSWLQEAEINMPNPNDYAYFGDSLDLTYDGNILVISATNANVGNLIESGKVYVYKFTSPNWNLQAELVPSDGDNYDTFGFSLDITDDGSTLVISNTTADIGSLSNAGKIYVFKYINNNWIEDKIIFPVDVENNSYFGQQVAITNDANHIIVTSNSMTYNGKITAGKAYVYKLDNLEYFELQQFSASDIQDNDQFGRSLAITPTFDKAVIGSSGDPNGLTNAGKAYVFKVI